MRFPTWMHLEILLHISPQLCGQTCHGGDLKLTVVGAFTPQKLANTASWGWFTPCSWLCNVCPECSLLLSSDLLPPACLSLRSNPTRSSWLGPQPPRAHSRTEKGEHGSGRSQWKIIGTPGPCSRGDKRHLVIRITLHVGQASVTKEARAGALMTELTTSALSSRTPSQFLE